jgi:hypothetical protein
MTAHAGSYSGLDGEHKNPPAEAGGKEERKSALKNTISIPPPALGHSARSSVQGTLNEFSCLVEIKEFASHPRSSAPSVAEKHVYQTTDGADERG